MDPKERLEALASTKVGYVKKKLEGDDRQAQEPLVVEAGQAETIVGQWPSTPQKVAKKLLERYGPPDEATPLRLIWHGNGPWKRTVVARDEIAHKFPTAHTDFITQYVDYRVPLDKVGDLVRFDGSVIIDRTAGEIAARCDMEAMNTLTLNLAHDIVTGKRTVDEAREYYAEQASAYVMDRPAPYTETLLFEAEAETADLDDSIIAEPMARQMAEKVKETIR